MHNNRPQPNSTIIEVSAGRKALWRDDSKWAQNIVATLPGDLAASLYTQYVARWEKYVAKSGQSRSANIWLRNHHAMITKAMAQFPIHIENLRNEVKRSKLANDLSAQCHNIMVAGSGAGATIKEVRDEMLQLPKQWGFSVGVPAQTVPREKNETNDEYQQRIGETVALSQMARMITEEWWARKLEIAYRRFCEHCRIIAGKVRKGVSAYLSRIALRDYCDRKLANQKALAQMVARNEITGEEITLLEAVQASVSNPEIRRHELMVRMRGFEDIAQEQGLVGGFFTVTAPSRYHAFIKSKNGKTYSNKKYNGANPKQTSAYLGKVWARARAKLNRFDVPIIGFRVCEPHHDATPHWHMLFFFKPEHEQIVRFVFADYFTRQGREELRVANFDFGYWASCFDKETRQLSPLSDMSLIEQTAKRISPRFDYKAIDPERGSATGYIAKYISKNIDGFKVEEDEEAGGAANITAQSVTGWASEWGIRQFQQIGGPPVSVWRELRRMEQDELTKANMATAKACGQKYEREVKSYIELKATKPAIEVARIAADSGSWSMFIEAMGGLFCPRKSQPLSLVYKPMENKYGECVTKLKGLTTKSVTMITRADGWVIGKKRSESAVASALAVSDDNRVSWSSVNNCTVEVNSSHNETKQTVFDHLQHSDNGVDMGTAAAIARGDKITTTDGKQIWLDKTAIGMQLRVSAIIEEYESGWPGWDYEDVAPAEPAVPEKSYKDKLRDALQNVELNTDALENFQYQYWQWNQ